MSRLTPSVIALVTAAGLAAPAIAADWQEEAPSVDESGYGQFRDAYPVTPGQWAGLGDEDDPIRIEFGARYWYSMGSGVVDDSSGTNLLSTSDTSHIGEGFLRIEDHSTNTFAKAIAGYSIAIDGTYSTPVDSGSIADGEIGYVGADFGWHVFGNNQGSGVGFLGGYQYWHEGANSGRNNFAVVTGDPIPYDTATGQTFIPLDSASNSIDAHMLRLGVEARADLGFIDFTGELAAVPYAKVDGVVGIEEVSFDALGPYAGPAQPPYDGVANGNISYMRTSATAMDGWGYGAQAEAWLGVHPIENMTMRVGARAWYLQGVADQTYSAASFGNPGDTEPDGVYDIDPSVNESNWITESNPFRMFRYGLMAELNYRF
ncbi:MAG: hypothetical protein ABL879_08175 [Devosia sp.]